MTAAFDVLMNLRRTVGGILLLICVFIYPYACLASQQLTIGQTSTIYLNPTLPSGGWLTHASWSTDVVGLTYFDAGTWGTGLKVDGYWPGTATLSCFYTYSYYGADGDIHVGNGNEYWYFTCKGYPVSINPTTIELDKGETADLTISISGSSIGNIPPLWESSDKTVATVYSTGDYTAKVQAKSPGWCTITCYSYMGEPVICDVHVKSFPPTGISISPSQAEVIVGKTVKLSGKLSPSGASAKLTWTSENASIATVANGTVTGKSPGKTRIKVATDNGLTAYADIKVSKNEPTDITISPSEVEITAGKTAQLKYTLYPNGTSTTVTWESQDPSIATVQNGTVTGVSGGTTIIKAKTANGLYDISTVTVIEYPRGPVSTSLSGNGTKDSPYLITSAADLRYLSDVVNTGTSFEGKYLKQTADISINSAPYNSDEFKTQELWIPIGCDEFPFKGIYDGDNYAITGIYIADTKDIYDSFSSIGLFGKAVNASFKNIKIANCLIDINIGFTGALVGMSSGNIDILLENCHVFDGLIKGHYVGGLVGKGTCNNKVSYIISKCSNSATVNSDFRANGLIGQFFAVKGSIYNCINMGRVHGSSSACGIVDTLYGSIYNSCNAGTISSDKGYVAGISGNCDPHKTSQGIYDCVNYGSLSTASASYSAVSILYRNNNSTRYYLTNNYYLNDCELAQSTKNITVKNNHPLSNQELKSKETLQNLNNSTDVSYTKWTTGENGYPIPDWYSELFAGIQDVIINDGHYSGIDYTKPVTVINLKGIIISKSIDNLASGIYIIRQGNTIRKIFVR